MKFNYLNTFIESSGLVIIPFLESNEVVEFNSIKVSKKLFSGKINTHYLLVQNDINYLFLGLGKELNFKNTKSSFRRISHSKRDFLTEKVSIIIPNFLNDLYIEAAISGFLLGSYNLGHFKSDKKESFSSNSNFILDLISDKDISIPSTNGLKIAQSQLEVFNLVDLPSNTATPEHLANWAKILSENYPIKTTVFNRKESQEKGLHAFLSVGQGSEREPQFIILEYNPASAKKHVGLVGKGITFDTGGLNIKTAGMVHMKCDMAGGAAVLGAMQLIASLELPYQVTAIVPACENSVDAKAFLPSDVISSYKGSSIEIIDTDAEGRLILADGLSYLINNFQPEIVVDLATLTGSSVATLGFECGALFSNNEELITNLTKAGDEIGERLWRLPLWDEYKSDIESDIADVKNYSGKPVAGAISAAKFLEYFTENHTAWAHLDIAGVAFGDDEFAKTKHATAFGVHLITNFIKNL
jgi:leucyl aminopeptidase